MTDTIKITNEGIYYNGALLTAEDKAIEVDTYVDTDYPGSHHHEVQVTLLAPRILDAQATDEDMQDRDGLAQTPVKITRKSVTYGSTKLRTTEDEVKIELIDPGDEHSSPLYGVQLTLVADSLEVSITDSSFPGPLRIN